MGKAVSQFSAPWANYPGNNFDGLVGGGGTITGVNQFSYTADFGQGVSGTIVGAGPDPILSGWRRQPWCIGASAQRPFPLAPATTLERPFPTWSAMLRVDQAWGLFQASFAAHDNHAAYYGGTGNYRPSRGQVGLGWSAGLVDQEHPDRTR